MIKASVRITLILMLLLRIVAAAAVPAVNAARLFNHRHGEHNATHDAHEGPVRLSATSRLVNARAFVRVLIL